MTCASVQGAAFFLVLAVAVTWLVARGQRGWFMGISIVAFAVSYVSFIGTLTLEMATPWLAASVWQTRPRWPRHEERALRFTAPRWPQPWHSRAYGSYDSRNTFSSWNGSTTSPDEPDRKVGAPLHMSWA